MIQILPPIGGAASIKNILIHCTYLNSALEWRYFRLIPSSHCVILTMPATQLGKRWCTKGCPFSPSCDPNVVQILTCRFTQGYCGPFQLCFEECNYLIKTLLTKAKTKVIVTLVNKDLKRSKFEMLKFNNEFIFNVKI